MYWKLIKSFQTFLLLITGVSGYLSTNPVLYNWQSTAGLIISLFLVISGSTVLNMVYDRDIDAKMDRTASRPLPSGRVSIKESFIFGILISIIGLGLAFYISLLYGLVIFAGIFIDVVIYTIWLKRKSALSILWGGISGGMPILAGRVLGVGEIDFIGALLSLSILLWIPTHILTFNIRFINDYKNAGVPTFPSKYGIKLTRLTIALSTLGAALSFEIGCIALGLAWGYVRLLTVLSAGIILIAIISITNPSDKMNYGLFKYASIFMLSAMLIVALGSYL